MILAAPLIAALVCAAALAYAHLALPAQTLVSDYALVPGGVAPVMVGMLALAAGCVFLAYGLAVREPARTAATRVLLVAAAGGLMLSALFPTDHGTASSLSGEVHRWASAVVFTSLPVAGWTLARGRAPLPRWNLVRSLVGTAVVALTVYLAAHPAALTSPFIGGEAYYGLLERAVIVAEVVLVVAMGVAASRDNRLPTRIPVVTSENRDPAPAAPVVTSAPAAPADRARAA
ncbi:DUF998 domain-containing protein [Nonomuraea africana]|uniref:DUF998 domain-containing protein n=1 Tax=Nonomuraea africana TaxID=46171 RepID=A0ABR9KWN6_9ACTN|nr:DUF998 domain-containing protein [Nonomuraea africana]MBE1566453.1 hypothetical protein [Nonomuraea africana]